MDGLTKMPREPKNTESTMGVDNAASQPEPGMQEDRDRDSPSLIRLRDSELTEYGVDQTVGC